MGERKRGFCAEVLINLFVTWGSAQVMGADSLQVWKGSVPTQSCLLRAGSLWSVAEPPNGFDQTFLGFFSSISRPVWEMCFSFHDTLTMSGQGGVGRWRWQIMRRWRWQIMRRCYPRQSAQCLHNFHSGQVCSSTQGWNSLPETTGATWASSPAGQNILWELWCSLKTQGTLLVLESGAKDVPLEREIHQASPGWAKPSQHPQALPGTSEPWIYKVSQSCKLI